MRPRCEKCERPSSACLCPAMPSERIQSKRTSVIILQHPLEMREKLATVPVLSKCLHPDCCEVVVGRKFRKGCCAQLDRAMENNSEYKFLLLFPASEATDLPRWVDMVRDDDQESRVILLIVDATWQLAKEMVRASMPYLKEVVVPVCLPFDKSREGLSIGGKSKLILRKEPYHGFMSTMEAVARALGFLEPDGPEIEQAILAVLHRMVWLQKVHLPKNPPAEDEQTSTSTS